MSKYLLQLAEGTTCPGCHSTVYLLIRVDGKVGGLPAFYICFACRTVAEVGKGPVERA